MKDEPRPVSPASASGAEPEPPDRLDSWKEIAAFLKRDVRTVQRWEKHVGLPVYRHAESRLRTAYAYRSELDAWWRTHRAAADAVAEEPDDPPVQTAPPAPPPTSSPEQATTGHQLRLTVLAAGAGCAAAVVILLGLARPGWRWGSAPAADSPPAVRVVLASFDDGTGDPSIGRLTDEALEHGLVRPGVIELVSPVVRTRILRMMRHAPDTTVSIPAAREIALREGRGAVVIGGRVRKLTSTYLVNVDAIEPTDGTITASVEREAADRDQLHAAVHAAAAEITKALGRPALTASPEPLEPVTTSSLGALRLYTEALAAGRRRQWPTAELLARRAFAADDQFAAAYAWAAWAMRNEGRPSDEVVAMATRAIALAPGLSDREVYLVNGTYHTLTGDIPKALAAYEALVRLDPSDTLALDRLIESYECAGRVRQAVEHSIRRADAHPNDFYANVRAAHALRIWNGDTTGAQSFIGRSRKLASRQARADRPSWTAWLALLPAFDRWVAGDPAGVLRETATAAAGLDSRIGRERDAFATAIGFSYLSVGHLHDAEAVFRRASIPTRQIDLALSALAVGDKRRAREWLLQVRDYSSERPALFARVGLLHEAEAGLASLAVTEHADAIAAVTRGLIAYRKHDLESAAESLRRGIDLLRYSGEPDYFIAVEALSRIWIKRGDPDRARALLAEAVSQRDRAYGSARWSGAYCIKLERELAALLERLGHGPEARALRAQVNHRLEAADPDYPAVRSAEDSEL